MSLSRELYNTYQAAWDEIPSQYRYQTSSWTTWSPQLCVTLLVIYLQYLYSGFQIERMLLQDGQVPISCLLETSMKLLSACSTLSSSSTHARNITKDTLG
jgi:hypothetical protein